MNKVSAWSFYEKYDGIFHTCVNSECQAYPLSGGGGGGGGAGDKATPPLPQDHKY